MTQHESQSEQTLTKIQSSANMTQHESQSEQTLTNNTFAYVLSGFVSLHYSSRFRTTPCVDYFNLLALKGPVLFCLILFQKLNATLKAVSQLQDDNEEALQETFQTCLLRYKTGQMRRLEKLCCDEDRPIDKSATIDNMLGELSVSGATDLKFDTWDIHAKYYRYYPFIAAGILAGRSGKYVGTETSVLKAVAQLHQEFLSGIPPSLRLPALPPTSSLAAAPGWYGKKPWPQKDSTDESSSGESSDDSGRQRRGIRRSPSNTSPKRGLKSGPEKRDDSLNSMQAKVFLEAVLLVFILCLFPLLFVVNKLGAMKV